MKKSFVMLFAIIYSFLFVFNSNGLIINVSSNENIASYGEELHLLRNEHYLYLDSSQDVETFNVWFSFPPDYQYQVPIILEIFNDTTTKLLNYEIVNDKNEPNKLINFTLKSIDKNEKLLLHFTSWVLVKNHDYGDLPSYVKFPEKQSLPEETKNWLPSTKVVQKDNFLIKLRAWLLKGGSDNLIEYAGKIAPFIHDHRILLFYIQYYVFNVLFSQDAVTTLLINGENVGRSHLACALFRTYDIPARVILVHNDQGFWTQMHYMVEYFCPDYGWVLLETTGAKTPYDTKRQIVNRVCYPSDEQDTKIDYIIPTMKGEERWLWISNENVVPYYVDCKEGSKSQMFSEAISITDTYTCQNAIDITKAVFSNYQKYLGKNLSPENLDHFRNATGFQNKGIDELIESNEINDYIDFMNQSYIEYLLIDE